MAIFRARIFRHNMHGQAFVLRRGFFSKSLTMSASFSSMSRPVLYVVENSAWRVILLVGICDIVWLAFAKKQNDLQTVVTCRLS